jgi:predicted outer membrane lipoprotein
VLALAALDVLIGLAFGGLYAIAGARWISQAAFLTGLACLFALLTAVWLRVEGRQSGGLEPVRRVGRAAIALVAVLVGAPIAVLLPLFGLEAMLPPDVVSAVLPLAPAMFLVLVALALVVLVHATAGVLLVAVGVLSRGRGRRPA